METEQKQKTVYCPLCGHKVGIWDGRTRTDQIYGCRKCWKKIIYHVHNGVTELKPWPERTTASGMTFI